jgi:hypothetical protein
MVITSLRGFRLDKRKKAFAVVSVVVLSLSLFFNWYYVNLSAENQNTLNNMRARTLASYGSEIVAMSFFLEKYVGTLDPDIIDHEVDWSIARTIWEADTCVQGLNKDSGLIYYELKGVSLALEFFFVWSDGYANTTKVHIIAQLLTSIGEPFSGLDMLKNKDPLQNLYRSNVSTIIDQCNQLIAVTGYTYYIAS